MRVWNSTTGECFAAHEFEKPIASLAFGAAGRLLAVASGRKLYVWDYARRWGRIT